MKVGTLVGVLGVEPQDWVYGIVIAPLVSNKTTVRWNSGLVRTYSAWETRALGIQVLS